MVGTVIVMRRGAGIHQVTHLSGRAETISFSASLLASGLFHGVRVLEPSRQTVVRAFKVSDPLIDPLISDALIA